MSLHGMATRDGVQSQQLPFTCDCFCAFRCKVPRQCQFRFAPFRFAPPCFAALPCLVSLRFASFLGPVCFFRFPSEQGWRHFKSSNPWVGGCVNTYNTGVGLGWVCSFEVFVWSVRSSLTTLNPTNFNLNYGSSTCYLIYSFSKFLQYFS